MEIQELKEKIRNENDLRELQDCLKSLLKNNNEDISETINITYPDWLLEALILAGNDDLSNSYSSQWHLFLSTMCIPALKGDFMENKEIKIETQLESSKKIKVPAGIDLNSISSESLKKLFLDNSDLKSSDTRLSNLKIIS